MHLPKNPQWSVSLDAYHRFVIERFERVYGTSRSDVIQQMVRAWVSDHADQVRQAGASIDVWREGREES